MGVICSRSHRNNPLVGDQSVHVHVVPKSCNTIIVQLHFVIMLTSCKINSSESRSCNDEELELDIYSHVWSLSLLAQHPVCAQQAPALGVSYSIL